MSISQMHQESKRTPLYSFHQSRGAILSPFGGWDMPIYYKSIIEEHRAVRDNVGLFDLSHMGEIWLRGRDAEHFLQFLITNDVRKLLDGKILYTPLCNDQGGIIDDILVYRKNDRAFLCVVNASNIQKDLEWLQSQLKGKDIEVDNASDETVLIGIQGPNADSILRKIFGPSVHNIPYYHFIELEFQRSSILVSRTGYTGEDGFELYISNDAGLNLWNELLSAGEKIHMIPVGLGARDTLRLEMRYPLYGNDICESTTPLESGLNWTVSFSKGHFIGLEALKQQRSVGIKKRLVGFEMLTRAIPRHGCAIKMDHEQIGEVTSGSFSPTLSKNIGLGYVPIQYGEIGKIIQINIRGKDQPARLVKTPFYKGASKKQ